MRAGRTGNLFWVRRVCDRHAPALPQFDDSGKTIARIFFVEAPIDNPIQPRYLQREAARRNADTLFNGRQRRVAVAKQEAASQSAANDAKTIRLRALRLEKEAADLEAETARKAAIVPRRVEAKS